MRMCKNCKYSEDGKPVSQEEICDRLEKRIISPCQMCMRNQPYTDNWEAGLKEEGV